jgi:RNA polymerase sigma factor (sigma-70 family)
MRQDESELLQALYVEYLVPLKKFAAKLKVNEDEIEDLVHETFIEYYERYPLDWPEKVKTTMLIRILRSKWVDINRRRSRCEFLRIDSPDDEKLIFRELLDNSGMVNLLDEEVLERDLYREIWKIVKEMKKDWRDVIILRIIEGLSTEETCEILNITGTVCRSRLYRGKKELQKKLKKARLFDI